MAPRAKRTIDPRKVTDIDSWLSSYKLEYANVVYHNGQYLVLDPAQYKSDYAGALAAPAKTIPSTKAIDAYMADKYPQLRAAADSILTDAREEKQKQITAAITAVNDAETELLKATLAWQTSETRERGVLALDVAKATKALENAEATLNAAKYPVRYIKAERGLLKKDLDYATHDPRKLHSELYRTVVEPLRLDQRIVPFTTGEGTA